MTDLNQNIHISSNDLVVQAQSDLKMHLVECTARYEVLEGRVTVQGKQLDRVEAALQHIIESVDSHIHAKDKEFEDYKSSQSDKILNLVLGIAAGLLGIVCSMIFGGGSIHF